MARAHIWVLLLSHFNIQQGALGYKQAAALTPPGDSAASLGPIKRLFFGLSLDPNKSKRKSVGPWISMEHRVMTKWHETPEKNEIEENCPGRKIIFI